MAGHGWLPSCPPACPACGYGLVAEGPGASSALALYVFAVALHKFVMPARLAPRTRLHGALCSDSVPASLSHRFLVAAICFPACFPTMLSFGLPRALQTGWQNEMRHEILVQHPQQFI